MKKVVTRLLICLVLLLQLTFQVAHAGSNQEIARLGRGTATSLAWRADGQVLAVGSRSGVWFFDKQMKQVQYIEMKAVHSVQWASQENDLLITKEDETAEIWSQGDSFSLVRRSILPIKGQNFIWSPNGKWVVVSNGDFQNGDYSGTLHVVNAQTGINKYSIDELTDPPYPSWSPDSLSLAIQTSDNTLEVVDAHTGNEIATYQSPKPDDYISAFAFGKNKDEITILHDWDSNAYIWNIKTSQITHKSISEHNDCLPTSLRVSNSGTAFICYGFSGSNDTINIISNSTLRSRQGILDNILDYDWQPNTSSITIIYNKGLLQTWDTQTDKVESYQPFISPNQISWGPDNKYLAVSSGRYGIDWAYPVALWAINKNTRNIAIPQPTSTVYPLTSTKWIGWKDTSTVLAYSDNQTFSIALCLAYDLESWDVTTSQKTDFAYDYGICGVDDLPANWKYIVEWSKDFKWVAYVEGDHINIAPSSPNKTTKLLLKPTISVQAINWSPDNNYLIIQGLDNKTAKTRIEIWNVEAGTLLKTLEFSNPIDEILWSPDAKRFALKNASVSDTWEIKIFDTNGNFDFTHSFTKPSNLINWSPDGQKLAIAEEASNTKLVHIIDAISNKEWLSYESNNTNLAWSADSEHLAYMILPKQMLVFADVISGTEIAQIEAMAVDSITLSPDGTTLALGMDDGTIRIWDVEDLMAK